MKANLKRMASPSLFKAHIEELSLHAEMQSNNRLRFKVQLTQNPPLSFSVSVKHLSLLAHKFTLRCTLTHLDCDKGRINSPLKLIFKSSFIKACLTQQFYRTKEDKNSDLQQHKVQTSLGDMRPHTQTLFPLLRSLMPTSRGLRSPMSM